MDRSGGGDHPFGRQDGHLGTTGPKLGKLRETRLQVFPGTYTLIGRRSGYREKRVEFSIAPGGAPVVVEMICDERF